MKNELAKVSDPRFMRSRYAAQQNASNETTDNADQPTNADSKIAGEDQSHTYEEVSTQDVDVKEDIKEDVKEIKNQNEVVDGFYSPPPQNK